VRPALQVDRRIFVIDRNYALAWVPEKQYEL